MSRPEVWLRGQLPDVPPLLQPVAHSLLHSREEVEATLPSLSPRQLWTRPGGAASAGYHVRHAGGALDRLFTYARGEPLSERQHVALAAEKEQDGHADAPSRLIGEFHAAIEQSLAQLRATPDGVLLDARLVGRAQLPSTVFGLLFHGAEHTQRHIGQLVVIAKVVRANLGDAR